MVYVDTIRRYHGRWWAHLWTDPGNEDELHAMAARLGLLRSWFQLRNGFAHYDVSKRVRAEAIGLGAVPTRLRDWLADRAKNN